MEDGYQVPICDCAGQLIFVDKVFNSNLKHNIYSITKTGEKGKIIGETDEEFLEGFVYYHWTKCKKCGAKWKSKIDEKGRVY